MRSIRNLVVFALGVQIILAAAMFETGIHRCGSQIRHKELCRAPGCVHAAKSSVADSARKTICCQGIFFNQVDQFFNQPLSEIVSDSHAAVHRLPHALMCNAFLCAYKDQSFRQYKSPRLFQNRTLINRVIVI